MTRCQQEIDILSRSLNELLNTLPQEAITKWIPTQELSIDTAKTHLWMKRVSNLLGEKYARDLAATYVTYTLPHKEEEKKEMIEMKHHQLFTKELNR